MFGCKGDDSKDGRDRNSHQMRSQDGRSSVPVTTAPPRVSATYVKSSVNGRTISGSREVTV